MLVLDRLDPPGSKAIALSQLTSRHGWSMLSRIMGAVMRSL
ncbi:MAG: hypothetical protein R3E18_11645 [Sphingomonadaceae bacterium]